MYHKLYEKLIKGNLLPFAGNLGEGWLLMFADNHNDDDDDEWLRLALYFPASSLTDILSHNLTCNVGSFLSSTRLDSNNKDRKRAIIIHT